MENFCKHSGSRRSRVALVIALTALALTMQTLASAPPASAAEAPAESPGCETYGCLYEHCQAYYGRGPQSACDYGIAYEQLADGPGNRKFVDVLWPENYETARRGMWDSVAFCESTWRWNINNGNGYHGGIQFHPTTWALYGGQEYAASAWQATPEQQISVGERVAFLGYTRPDGSVVGAQGTSAWPRCGRYLSQ